MHQITLYTVYQNDKGEDDLKVLPKLDGDDRGLLYGDGVFETILIKNRRPLYLEAHLKRMVMGLRRLNIFCKVPMQRFKSFIEEDILDANERDGVLRISATRGRSNGILSLYETSTPNFIFEIKPLGDQPPLEIDLIIAAERRNEFSAISTIKTLNYLSNLSARQEATRLKAFDAIMLNTSGDVAECTSANIFAIFKNELITPPLESGILPGITRGIVLSLAVAAKLQETSRKITPNELAKANEVFITNSIKGILPVKKIDQREYPGANGVYTQKLIQLYELELSQEI